MWSVDLLTPTPLFVVHGFMPLWMFFMLAGRNRSWRNWKLNRKCLNINMLRVGGKVYSKCRHCKTRYRHNLDSLKKLPLKSSCSEYVVCVTIKVATLSILKVWGCHLINGGSFVCYSCTLLSHNKMHTGNERDTAAKNKMLTAEEPVKIHSIFLKLHSNCPLLQNKWPFDLLYTNSKSCVLHCIQHTIEM